MVNMRGGTPSLFEYKFGVTGECSNTSGGGIFPFTER
jgi:hypothetical protein